MSTTSAALIIMWKGMIAIFAVMVILLVLIKIINKITSPNK